MLVRVCILILAIFAGCKRAEEKPSINYHPFKAGSFAEFEVLRTAYGIAEGRTTTKLTVKERMGDSFRDATEQIVFPIHYETWHNNTWRPDSSSLMWQTPNKVFALEHGHTVIKLLLPVADRNFWDGNAYNNTGEQRFEIRNVGKALAVDTQLFPNTITVIRQNDSTLLSQRKFIEVYAEGVGLIQREKVYVNFCYEPGCTGKAVIQSGWTEISKIKRFEK
jgi:hypothetical protein